MDLIERMNLYIVDNGQDACTEWTGGKNAGGYPMFWDGQKSRQAGIILWESVYGPLTSKLQVQHNCDNPECLNILHLKSGYCLENILDKYRHERGTTNKLSLREVTLVRALLKAKKENVSVRSFAAIVGPIFSVSQHTIRGLASGTTWGWYSLKD